VRSWRGAQGEADFFAAKALLEGLLGRFNVGLSARPASFPFLHPGRSAEALADGERIGFLGELHPLVASSWDLARTAVFAVDLDRLAQAVPADVAFRPFASVPALRQDLAVTLPSGVPAAQVLEAVSAAAGPILADVSVFDVYTGEQVGEDRRSLALALSFQSPERTLTDEDAAPVRERIIAALRELGGELRG
jgi:phenylalanyl-tRNA synthetase beta chain